MTVEKTVCDECGRIKGEANHWHQMSVGITIAGNAWLELGALQGPGYAEGPDRFLETYAVHDLCGEQCFFKHVAKLLNLNPVLEAA